MKLILLKRYLQGNNNRCLFTCLSYFVSLLQLCLFVYNDILLFAIFVSLLQIYLLFKQSTQARRKKKVLEQGLTTHMQLLNPFLCRCKLICHFCHFYSDKIARNNKNSRESQKLFLSIPNSNKQHTITAYDERYGCRATPAQNFQRMI